MTDTSAVVFERLAFGERAEGIVAVARIPDTTLDRLDLPPDALVVVLEGVIDRTGCVRSVEVLRGIAALNWESIRAVSQWKYTPTLLDGRPVPVRMTITVNYRLN